MPRASSDRGRAAPGRRRPSFRDARALILGALRGHGWVWRLSMLWVVMGAGGAGYALVCTMRGCTTNQCTNDEFLFPLYNGEPRVIATVGALAATAWVLLAVPIAVGGVRPAPWLAAAQLAPHGCVGRCVGRGFRAHGPGRSCGSVGFRLSRLGVGRAGTANLRRVAGTRCRDKPDTVHASPQQGCARDQRPFQQAGQLVIRRTVVPDRCPGGLEP